MSFRVVGYTEKGDNNSVNEDHVLINGTLLKDNRVAKVFGNTVVAVISDGVGGLDKGEVASKIVADGFKDMDPGKASIARINWTINDINQRIIKGERCDNNKEQMAATLAGIVIVDNAYISFNIGDTRIYSYGDSAIRQISEDHVVHAPREKEPYASPGSVITRYMGGDGHGSMPYIIHGKIKDGMDSFLMCSDGIYRSVDRADIWEILCLEMGIDKKTAMLIDLAKRNGATDDKSIVIIESAA